MGEATQINGLTLEPGRKVAVVYPTENLWHERILLKKTDRLTFEALTQEAATDTNVLWWILTPDGHVYPEELSAGAHSAS